MPLIIRTILLKRPHTIESVSFLFHHDYITVMKTFTQVLISVTNNDDIDKKQKQKNGAVNS